MGRPAFTRPGRTLPRVLLVAVSLVSCGVAAELALRAMLFGGLPAFEGLRRPGSYASRFADDDYWKLHHRFRRAAPRASVHPLLGWVGSFDHDSLRHRQEGELRGRRPVLLYGDSFAEGIAGVIPIDELVNRDEAFAAGHCLLNYGVSGYGLDQIALLVRATLDLYPDPVVVVSWMSLDLDRVVLTVRDLPKPYFRIEHGELVLRGTPLPADPEDFYRAHPPRVRSYLLGRMRYSRLAQRVARRLGWDETRLQEKRALGRAILSSLVHELRARDVDCVLVILHPQVLGVSTLDGAGEWRDEYFRALLGELGAESLWAKDLLRATLARGARPDELIDPRNGHPTHAYNAVVARAIRDRVLAGFSGAR